MMRPAEQLSIAEGGLAAQALRNDVINLIGRGVTTWILAHVVSALTGELFSVSAEILALAEMFRASAHDVTFAKVRFVAFSERQTSTIALAASLRSRL